MRPEASQQNNSSGNKTSCCASSRLTSPNWPSPSFSLNSSLSRGNSATEMSFRVRESTVRAGTAYMLLPWRPAGWWCRFQRSAARCSENTGVGCTGSRQVRRILRYRLQRQRESVGMTNCNLHYKLLCVNSFPLHSVLFSHSFHAFLYLSNNLFYVLSIEGIVHPKMKILSSFFHPHVVPNLYEFCFFCGIQKIK